MPRLPATYAIRMASPKGAPSLWGRAGGEASILFLFYNRMVRIHPFISSAKTPISSEEIPISSEEILISSAKIPISSEETPTSRARDSRERVYFRILSEYSNNNNYARAINFKKKKK